MIDLLPKQKVKFKDFSLTGKSETVIKISKGTSNVKTKPHIIP